MSAAEWFSAKLQFIALQEREPASLTMQTIILFQAADFTDALARAVAIGRRAQEEYGVHGGTKVRWRLREVLTLDMVPAPSADGTEVYSEFVDVDTQEPIGWSAEFEPERSKPVQTTFKRGEVPK
jgi:hypothetical protein